MSKTYVFKNAGVIDPRSITTFGVSSKVGKNPVGFFGTGLKYAIAVLLRLKCQVVIYSGNTGYTFTTRSERIRVNDFDLVCMNGEPCGFTTELGKTWEIWQAFRELACNAKDEDGLWKEVTGAPSSFEDSTHVLVSGSAFDSVWAQRHSIMLDSAPIYSLADQAEIHAGKSHWLYYRGVRCQKLNKPSLYTYNILREMDLTEDRGFKYDWYAESAVTHAVLQARQSAVIDAVVTADDQTWERRLAFPSGSPMSEQFKNVVVAHIKKFTSSLSQSARALVQAQHMEDLDMGDEIKLSKTDTLRLAKATAFLARIGYDASAYPIKVRSHLGDGVLGRAHRGVILVSRLAFEQGTKRLAGTIFEEYLHLSTGCVDLTYGMQNMLIDAIMSMGEQATGEIL